MSRFTDARDDVAEASHDTSEANKTRCEEYLNEAKDEILSENLKWDWLQETVTFDTVSGTSEYPLADLVPDGESWNITLVRSVRIPAEDCTLESITPEAFDSWWPEPDDHPGQPYYYMIWDGSLFLGPQPNAVFELSVKVYRDIPDFSTVGNETPPWPKRYDRTWKHYAMFLAHEFDDDTKANKYLNLFGRGVKRMKGGDSREMNKTVRLARHDGHSGRRYRGPGYDPHTYPWPYGR